MKSPLSDQTLALMRRYGIALAAVGIATMLTWTLRNILEAEALTLLLLPAIVVSAWYGGLGPGLLSTFLAAAIVGILRRDPRNFWLDNRLGENLQLLLFAGEGLLAVWLLASRAGTRRSRIAGQSHVREEEPRYRQLVEGVTDYAILLVDRRGDIVTWSEAAQRIVGYHTEEIVGHPFARVYRNAEARGGQANQLLEIAAREGRCELEVPCQRKDGQSFWADIAIAALHDERGDLCGFSAVLRDINARKQAEETHQQRAQQLTEANRLKDEFLATMSHELRTPLNSILGWAQLLRSGKLDDADRRHALETIEQSAKTQARLIEDLLDVSRIITGKMRLDVKTIPLTEVIEPAIETVRPAADAKGIEIQTRLDPTASVVYGDPNRLQQVVWNLLSNAIKFTPRGGVVQVRLERHHSQVELAVQDTGVGIKPNFLPYVFDAFRQADSSSTRSHKGLGLGLAIVRHLVELHGGTVSAESAGEGQGTTFRVLLPVASVQTATSASMRRHPPTTQITMENLSAALHDLRVVVVDDDPGALELLSMLLRNNGVQVTAAASAAEGLTAVQRIKPDVLLSDIEMPDEDGYTFLRKLRKLRPELGGDTPAVALTAYARAEDRSRAFQAGFQLHLAKPVVPDELASAIAALADQRQKDHADVQVAGH